MLKQQVGLLLTPQTGRDAWLARVICESGGLKGTIVCTYIQFSFKMQCDLIMMGRHTNEAYTILGYKFLIWHLRKSPKICLYPWIFDIRFMLQFMYFRIYMT